MKHSFEHQCLVQLLSTVRTCLPSVANHQVANKAILRTTDSRVTQLTPLRSIKMFRNNKKIMSAVLFQVG